jgi:hypothetical protein
MLQILHENLTLKSNSLQNMQLIEICCRFLTLNPMAQQLHVMSKTIDSPAMFFNQF